MLRSELQAELELAFSTSELDREEVLRSVGSFLAQDDDWRSTEEWLRSYRRPPRRTRPPRTALRPRRRTR
jgi:hypothetical protein